MVHIFPSMLNIMSCFGFGIAGAMTIGTKTENILTGISVQVVGISAKHHLQLMRWEPVPDWTHLAGGNISLGTSLLRATSSPSGFAHPAFDDPIGHIARSQWPGSTIISCHIQQMILFMCPLFVAVFPAHREPKRSGQS